MGNKKTIQHYKWQPELSLSLIYWSLTFGIFFLGVISWLEETQINVFAIGNFILFAVLFAIGCRRILKIEKDQIIIRALLKRNSFQGSLKMIRDISVGSNGLTIHFVENSPKKSLSLMMMSKTKERFLSDLASQTNFNGGIYRVEKSAE